jgi:hypothetical protein
MPTSRSFYGGNNAFTSPGTANVSALFPRSLSEVSESSDALFPRSLSEFSQFSECSEDTGNKALDSARCPHRKSWKRLRAKKGCAFFVCFECGAKWRTRGTMDSEEEVVEAA